MHSTFSLLPETKENKKTAWRGPDTCGDFLNELTRRGKAKWFVVCFFCAKSIRRVEERRGEERGAVMHCVVNSAGMVQAVTCGQI
jgi:hypothetical protein